MPSAQFLRLSLCLSSISLLISCTGGDVGNVDDTSTGQNTGSTGSTDSGSGGQVNGPGSGGNGNVGTGSTGNGAGGGSTNSGGSNNGNTGGGANPGSGGGGPDVDEQGKGIAKPGDVSTMNQDYLRLGDIRILNNNWGSAERGCDSKFSVFVNENKSFGWTFDRGACGGDGSQPDFPQIEFGVHPFGIGSALATSPEFSSTTLLPIQIKNLQTASVTIDNLRIELEQESSWNITFEFWVSQRDPLTSDAGVYAELMTFWGWQGGRWPTAPGADGAAGVGTGETVNSAGKDYTLWVQRDGWADGWRYFQFRANDGPKRDFDGTVDVKPLLDHLLKISGFSSDFWITRLEVGSEIDDGTKGKVTLDGISFEINGESRSAIIADP
jgi:hypothetical protein